VGYVISATFLVAIVVRQPGMAGGGNLTWVVVGLAAAPAVIWWDRLARRAGDVRALLAAYAVQIVSFLLPLFFEGLAAALLGAVLYGATFIGIVGLTLAYVGRHEPANPARAMARLTLSYGAGQILAPAVAGQIAQHTGSYQGALWMAAGLMALGMVLLVLLDRQQRRLARRSPLSDRQARTGAHTQGSPIAPDAPDGAGAPMKGPHEDPHPRPVDRPVPAGPVLRPELAGAEHPVGPVPGPDAGAGAAGLDPAGRHGGDLRPVPVLHRRQQAHLLMESRRFTKELQAQRQLADQAEASRFTELQTRLEAGGQLEQGARGPSSACRPSRTRRCASSAPTWPRWKTSWTAHWPAWADAGLGCRFTTRYSSGRLGRAHALAALPPPFSSLAAHVAGSHLSKSRMELVPLPLQPTPGDCTMTRNAAPQARAAPRCRRHGPPDPPGR
jgi:hypothetical protein